MASFFKAVGNMFREKRDHAAKALSDPVRDGKFAIEDSVEQIREFRTEVAKLRKETIKQEAQRKEALLEKKKYDGLTKQAAQQGPGTDEEDDEILDGLWDRLHDELQGADERRVEAAVTARWLAKHRSARMANDWLAHMRSIHPDDPNRPIVILDAA